MEPLDGRLHFWESRFNLLFCQHCAGKLQAASKNSFLQDCAEDFVPNQVMEIPEYFVYCGIFIKQSWGKRFAQDAKGEFLEVPYSLNRSSIFSHQSYSHMAAPLRAIHITLNIKQICPPKFHGWPR